MNNEILQRHKLNCFPSFSLYLSLSSSHAFSTALASLCTYRITIMAHIVQLTVLNLDQENVVLMFAEDFWSHSVEGNITASLCVPRSYKL